MNSPDPSTQGLQAEILPGLRAAVGNVDRVIIYPALARLFRPKPLDPVRTSDYHGITVSLGKAKRWRQEDKRKGRDYPRWEEAQRRKRPGRPNKNGDVYIINSKSQMDDYVQSVLRLKREKGLQFEEVPRFFSMGCTVDKGTGDVRPLPPVEVPSPGLKVLAGRDVVCGILSWSAEPGTPTCPPKEEL